MDISARKTTKNTEEIADLMVFLPNFRALVLSNKTTSSKIATSYHRGMSSKSTVGTWANLGRAKWAKLNVFYTVLELKTAEIAEKCIFAQIWSPGTAKQKNIQ